MTNTFQGIDASSGVNVATGALIQLPQPRHPYRLKTDKTQASARTLGGTFYVYDRSLITRTYTVNFPKVTAAVLAQIVTLFDTLTLGEQAPFFWTDHLGTTRVVKLQGGISITPTSNIYFTVSLTLFEQFTDEAVFHDWPYMGTDYVGTGYVQT